MTERREIGRIKGAGYASVDRVRHVVFAANTCRRCVTVHWEAATDSLVFYAIVPVPKKVLAIIQKKK